MKDIFLLAGVIVAASCMLGCGAEPTEEAATGAPPTISTPVGPPPGPGQAMNLPKNPYSSNPVALSEGRQLFVHYNCYGCHGGHGGGGMGPSLRGIGDPDARVFVFIAEGKDHGMPAWGTKIPRDQIWKLVTYIKSMRTNHEPDPPPPFPSATPTSPTAE